MCRLSRFRLLILFLYLFLSFAGYALKCYQCLSYKSWDDCKSRTKEVTCLYNQDSCGKEHVKKEISVATVEGFAKGCSTSSICNANNCKSMYPHPADVRITECEIDCCKGDLCNEAQVSMVSAIMLLACAILAFSR